MTDEVKCLAHTNEVVTCKNGHYMCQVASDLYSSQVIKRAQFKNWRGDMLQHIKPRAEVPKCPTCKSSFIGYVQNKLGIYINGKFRGGGSYAR